MQPGAHRPEKQLPRSGAKAVAKSNPPNHLTRSQQGRRVVKQTTYKSQAKLADFVMLVAVTVADHAACRNLIATCDRSDRVTEDSHILGWLQDVDSTYLHKDCLKIKVEFACSPAWPSMWDGCQKTQSQEMIVRALWLPPMPSMRNKGSRPITRVGLSKSSACT